MMLTLVNMIKAPIAIDTPSWLGSFELFIFNKILVFYDFIRLSVTV